jgi:uncharacterized membrane protein YccC
VGLPESVWAAMFALIVSQEQLHDTRSSLVGQIFGTLLGATIAVAVSHGASRVGASTAMQMTAAVAIAALVVHEVPTLRVAMWTCPITLLSAPSEPVLTVGLHRASEVILGAVVGWTFHWAAEAVVDACARAASPQTDREAQ